MKHDVCDFKYLSPADVYVEDWCAKYGLKVYSSKCLECATERYTTIPAYGKTWRGLVAPKCVCGFDGPIQRYILKPNVDPGEFIKFLQEF